MSDQEYLRIKTIPIRHMRVKGYITFANSIFLFYAGKFEQLIGVYDRDTLMVQIPTGAYARIEMMRPFDRTRWIYQADDGTWYEYSYEDLPKEVKTWLAIMNLSY